MHMSLQGVALFTVFFTLQFGTSISWEGNCMASHWPCATDTMFYPPMGSMGKDREMSTHAYVPSGCGTIYRFFLPYNHLQFMIHCHSHSKDTDCIDWRQHLETTCRRQQPELETKVK